MQEVRRFKPSTVSRRISIVAGFFRTCVIDGVLPTSPAEHVRRPNVPPESPTLGLTHLQFEAMLTDEGRCEDARRDHAEDCPTTRRLRRTAPSTSPSRPDRRASTRTVSSPGRSTGWWAAAFVVQWLLVVVLCVVVVALARQVGTLHLRLGPLSGVVKEALLSAYDLAREVSPLAHTRLVIEDVPVVVYCERCQGEQSIESMQEFCCPKCGTPTANVIRGRELEIVAMEIEE
jgi:hydrogenase nickel insertion protein HypA